MKTLRMIAMFGMAAGVLSAGCGSTQDVQRGATGTPTPRVADDDDDEGDDDEVEIALDQVPAAIRHAAEEAVPGFVLKSAETETEEGSLHYCLEGTAGGEMVEVEVSTDGKVLEIERGDDEDED